MNRIRKSLFAAAIGSIVTFGSGTAFGADVTLKLSGGERGASGDHVREWRRQDLGRR